MSLPEKLLPRYAAFQLYPGSIRIYFCDGEEPAAVDIPERVIKQQVSKSADVDFLAQDFSPGRTNTFKVFYRCIENVLQGSVHLLCNKDTILPVSVKRKRPAVNRAPRYGFLD